MSINQRRSKFHEDVKTSGGGTNLVATACVIWNLTVSRENTGVSVVSFSDSGATYSSANKKIEVVLSGATTHSIQFPKGLYLANGLSVISNLASVDVSIVYD